MNNEPKTTSEESTGTECGQGCSYAPRVDILEDDNQVMLFADLPGVKPEDVDLHYEGGELRVKARYGPRPDGRRFLAEEYGVGDFYRAFTIPQQIDAAKIAADLKQGVLTVRLPKSEAIKPKKICVQGS